jgi:hypothetical protein
MDILIVVYIIGVANKFNIYVNFYLMLFWKLLFIKMMMFTLKLKGRTIDLKIINFFKILNQLF